MSIITSHLEKMFDEVLVERAYRASHVRTVLVAGSRFMQKAVKKIDRYYQKTLLQYPELMTTDELIKAACAVPARDDNFIIRTLQVLEPNRSKLGRVTVTPTIEWFRNTYVNSVFPAGPPLKVAPVYSNAEIKTAEMRVKTEILDKLDKKKSGKKSVKPLKNEDIFKP